MRVLHLYKADHNFSSRILNQISIDKGDILSTSTNPRLSLKNLYQKKSMYDVFVFHCQSSIFFMMFLLFFKSPKNIRYDIHDFNEHDFQRGFKFNLRFLIIYILEIFVTRIIKICNVSEGNKGEYSYRGHVFLNLPFVKKIDKKIPESLKKDFIFFGTEERCPKVFFNLAEKGDINLSIHGIFSDECKDEIIKSNIAYKGKYNPNNLDFLEEYKFSIIYFPDTNKKNMKNSLPNKFFQSVLYSLNICISGNFTEMINFCEKYEIAYNIIKTNEDLLNLTFIDYSVDFEKIIEQNNNQYLEFIYDS